MAPDTDVDEVERLMGAVQIRDVRCLEFSAQALDLVEERHKEQQAAETEAPAKLQLKVRQESDHIAVHGRVVLDASAARAVAEVAAFYTKAHDVEYSSAALEEFVRRVGAFTIWPYLREAIAEATRRVSADPYILGVLRLGNVGTVTTV